MVAIAIVRSRFNEEITEQMLKSARKCAARLGMKVVAEATVPGAFDMPIVVKKMLERSDVDGVATIGAVIKGKTKHDEVIAHEVARALIRLSLEYEKPVGLGIIGPGVTWKLAEERASDYAQRSVEAVLKLHNELKKI
jgi:6,7-dimethyl-8-ribityllumazine synthase